MDRKSLTALLRETIRESGLSLRLLANETGVERASISRFMAGQQSLRLDKVDLLCERLGISHKQKRGEK